MPRISKYGPPRSARFLKFVDNKLQEYCLKQQVNESDVIQESVECFLLNESCEARKRRKFKRPIEDDKA